MPRLPEYLREGLFENFRAGFLVFGEVVSGGPAVFDPGDALLLENGDFFLLESGDKLLLEPDGS